MTPLEKVEAEIIETVKAVVAERDRALFLLESARALSEQRRLKIEELEEKLDWYEKELASARS